MRSSFSSMIPKEVFFVVFLFCKKINYPKSKKKKKNKALKASIYEDKDVDLEKKKV